MKKKKSVTMWAIWSPYINEPLLGTASYLRKDAWQKLTDTLVDLEEKTGWTKAGYRAVKGKFVWEEKC